MGGSQGDGASRVRGNWGHSFYGGGYIYVTLTMMIATPDAKLFVLFIAEWRKRQSKTRIPCVNPDTVALLRQLLLESRRTSKDTAVQSHHWLPACMPQKDGIVLVDCKHGQCDSLLSAKHSQDCCMRGGPQNKNTMIWPQIACSIADAWSTYRITNKHVPLLVDGLAQSKHLLKAQPSHICTL